MRSPDASLLTRLALRESAGSPNFMAMQKTRLLPTAKGIDPRVVSFQSSGERGPRAIADFLPSRCDMDYLSVLRELVRCDIDNQRQAGRVVSFEEYRAAFPELKVVPQSIDVQTSVVSSPDLSMTPAPLRSAFTRIAHVSPLSVDVELADATPFPNPGDFYHGFELQRHLGKGAFGQVYLASERKLAGRSVVLKLTGKPNGESQRLAQLQHTNIVPIHNAFYCAPHHVVQMPYLGEQTLSDVIEYVRTQTGFPKIGGDVFRTTAAQLSTMLAPISAPQGTTDVTGTIVKPTPPTTPTEAKVFDASHPFRAILSRMSYPAAVIEIVRAVADGLAHAHAHGILHLDLKPQNVLFSDVGQPMLLDFNLSYDRKNQTRDKIGGTWPYMAPESIREYLGTNEQTVDERTDLYALGVMFFELLTCQLPFAKVRHVPDDLENAIAEREAGVRLPSEINPEVTPAYDAIVRKLLEPKPECRYQTATELIEDLRCQQANQPLKHAPNTSLRERVVKWHMRNPRVAFQTCATITGLALFATMVLLSNVSRARDRSHAQVESMAFHKLLATSQLDLTAPTDFASRKRGIEAATKWMASYGVRDRKDWYLSTNIRCLPDEQKLSLRNELGETALLLAHAEWLNALRETGDERSAAEVLAVRWNQLAEECYPSGNIPQAVWQQRRNLAESTHDANLLKSIPSSITDRTVTIDLFLAAARSIAIGQLKGAEKQLAVVIEREPDHFASNFLLACCYHSSGQNLRALERYQVAKTLSTNDPRPSYNLGLVFYQSARFLEAETEFTRAIDCPGDFPNASWQRAAVRHKLGNTNGGLADVQLSLAQGGPKISLMYLRSQLHQQLGDAAAAKQDRLDADAIEPTTEIDFVARGVSRVAKEPLKALADFQSATKRNPLYLPAWHNKAHVLGEHLHETELALEAITQAVAVSPQHAPSVAGQAVLLARLERRKEAHEAIQTALLLSRDPEIAYQASNVYSLTSATNLEDRATALAYFRDALRDGYRNFPTIEHDPDNKNLHGTVEYRDIFNAAKTLVR